MRKLLAVIAVLLGCLLAAQSAQALVAAYSDCCGDECRGLAQCANSACQVCVVPLALAARTEPLAPPREAQLPTRFAASLPPVPVVEIWNPPD